MLGVLSFSGAASFSVVKAKVSYSAPRGLGCGDWVVVERGVVNSIPEFKELLGDESAELDELFVERVDVFMSSFCALM